MRKRCLFGIPDDLQDYAERMLSGRAAELAPIFSRYYGPVTSSLVHREQVYQTELVQVAPSTMLPSHRHPGVDSIECPLEGFIRFIINGEDPYEGVTDARLERFALGKLVRIAGNAWHGGITGPAGVRFLSMQRWPIQAPYGLIGERWEGAHVSVTHSSLARGRATA